MSHHRLGHDAEAAAALESAGSILLEGRLKLDQQALFIQNFFREAESVLRER